MDSPKKTERLAEKKVERTLVFCNNLPGLIDHICHHREIDQEDRYYIMIGIDGGGSLLKVCFNLEKYDPLVNQESLNKKWSYATGAFSKKFKDSGVNKLIVLGIVEDVCENYDNVKFILEHMNFEILQNEKCTYIHMLLI